MSGTLRADGDSWLTHRRPGEVKRRLKQSTKLVSVGDGLELRVVPVITELLMIRAGE